MRIIFPITAGVLCLFLCTSCGNSRKTFTESKSSTIPEKELPGFEHEILDRRSGTMNRRKEEVKSANEVAPLSSLVNFVEEWEGTPHRMGGNTKKGVDCSGFVIQAYQNVFSISFRGRRAEDIFSEIDPIRKEELTEGDLVFFKINGRRIDHVGIYLGEGEFAHASSSRGVMVSHLEENYYKQRFFMGGRVME